MRLPNKIAIPQSARVRRANGTLMGTFSKQAIRELARSDISRPGDQIEIDGDWLPLHDLLVLADLTRPNRLLMAIPAAGVVIPIVTHAFWRLAIARQTHADGTLLAHLMLATMGVALNVLPFLFLYTQAKDWLADGRVGITSRASNVDPAQAWGVGVAIAAMCLGNLATHLWMAASAHPQDGLGSAEPLCTFVSWVILSLMLLYPAFWLGRWIGRLLNPGSTASTKVVPEATASEPGIVGAPEVALPESLGPTSRVISSYDYQSRKTFGVVLDLSSQVLSLSVPRPVSYEGGEGRVEAELSPTFPVVEGPSFTGAAVLSFKAKQFDDRLYACVERAAQLGLGDAMGKRALLLDLVQSLTADSPETALLAAAARLGGAEPTVDSEVSAKADEIIRGFLANEELSKPLGFYSESAELRRIFQCDRLLQGRLDEPEARALAMVLASDEDLAKSYGCALHLTERLTNALAWADLREPAAALQQGRSLSFQGSYSLFPPSRSFETDLMSKLYGDRPIPEAFDLAEEMVRRIRDGRLDLTPAAESGWYDHQTYALAAIAAPDLLREGPRLEIDASYRKELEGLFKALLALSRETHVKQLELMPCGMAARGPELVIRPNLSIEPLPTYYLRRAQSYRFVRAVLEDVFGPDGLDSAMANELRQTERLFRGAHLRSCEEIGLEPEESPTADDREALDTWLKSVDGDPDLGRDVRMMVPVFYDLERRKTKVWMVLGVAAKRLDVRYKSFPTLVGVRDPTGKAVHAKIVFEDEHCPLPYFATAETYVTAVLDRAEFRQHCDRHKTSKAILENLR